MTVRWHDTVTVPERTLINVPVHVSCVSQKVPRTSRRRVAPNVSKWPLPFPHRLRVFEPFADAAHELS